MADERIIPYGGSKAVKITTAMKQELQNHVKRGGEIADYDKEIKEQEALRDAKNGELKVLHVTAEGEDKKEAKEANKAIKATQKEIDKIDSNIKDIENKKGKLVTVQTKANIAGTNIMDYAAAMQPVEEPAEEPVVTENPFDISETPVNEEPQIEEVQLEEQKTEEIPVEVDVPEAAEEPIDDDFAAELDDDLSAELDDFPSEEETVSDDSLQITDDEANEIWEGLKNVELNEEPKTIEPVEPDYSDMVVTPVYEEPTVPVNDEFTMPSFDTEPVVETPVVTEPEISPEEIQAEVHNDIENTLPTVEVDEPFDAEQVMNNVYGEVGVTPEEPVETTERDLENLTLFKDHEDYTFAFGQKLYGREALTPAELESLENEKDFINEKAFESKRLTQYKKITDENKKLKTKVTTLGKEFKKNVESIGATYTKDVEKLNKATKKAKEQAEADRVEKIQTQKLNDSLTATINEQTVNIETLTTNNADLQNTIENQKSQISDLEKVNKEQAEKIRMFEEKLNTVFGIVKEVSEEN